MTPAMEKPANAPYPLHPLIEARWSPRAFADREVEVGKICSLLEAARWAPSCYNEQPWRFFFGLRQETPQAYAILQDLLVPGNAWAKKAPVLMLSVAKRHFSHDHAPNRHALHDVGLAVANMVLQAQSLGLVCHQMAGFYPDKALERLQIPAEAYEPVAMMAIGYPGDPETLEEPLRSRERAPRSRRPLQELVFSDQWGAVFPLCFT
jgi:nitroreductase